MVDSARAAGKPIEGPGDAELDLCRNKACSLIGYRPRRLHVRMQRCIDLETDLPYEHQVAEIDVTLADRCMSWTDKVPVLPHYTRKRRNKTQHRLFYMCHISFFLLLSSRRFPPLKYCTVPPNPNQKQNQASFMSRSYRSIDSNSALKLPLPNPPQPPACTVRLGSTGSGDSHPTRWMISMKSVGRSPTGRVKTCLLWCCGDRG